MVLISNLQSTKDTRVSYTCMLREQSEVLSECIQMPQNLYRICSTTTRLSGLSVKHLNTNNSQSQYKYSARSHTQTNHLVSTKYRQKRVSVQQYVELYTH